jgi:hypothetical protein
MGIIDPLLSGTKSDTISSTESESSALWIYFKPMHQYS